MRTIRYRRTVLIAFRIWKSAVRKTHIFLTALLVLVEGNGGEKYQQNGRDNIGDKTKADRKGDNFNAT